MEFGKNLDAIITECCEKVMDVGVAQAAEMGGATYNPEDPDTLDMTFIGRHCRVNCKDGTVYPIGHSRVFSDIERAIIMNYLVNATGCDATGEMVTFRDLRKDGSFETIMKADADMPKFDRVFGVNPPLLQQAINTVPGERMTLGDSSIKITALPRIPIIFVVWEGEDNIIPPSSTVLFDRSFNKYLPPEFSGVLTSVVVKDLIQSVL